MVMEKGMRAQVGVSREGRVRRHLEDGNLGRCVSSFGEGEAIRDEGW